MNELLGVTTIGETSARHKVANSRMSDRTPYILETQYRLEGGCLSAKADTAQTVKLMLLQMYHCSQRLHRKTAVASEMTDDITDVYVYKAWLTDGVAALVRVLQDHATEKSECGSSGRRVPGITEFHTRDSMSPH